MSSNVKAITIDCAAWQPLVDFWSRATRYHEDPADPNRPGDEVGLLIDPDGGPALLFQLVPDEKVVKNRVHLDLVPDTTRDAEVARLLDLGATLVGDHRRPDGSGWVTLADPGGNEFCVERSAAERADMRPAAT